MEKKSIEAEFDIAETFLKDARLLLDAGGSLRSVISRIYYALFHASRALLVQLGLNPKTHKGTINLFLKEVVNKNLCSIDSAKLLSKMYKMREDADYDVALLIDKEQVKEMLDNAYPFVKEMKVISKRLNKSKD